MKVAASLDAFDVIGNEDCELENVTFYRTIENLLFKILRLKAHQSILLFLLNYELLFFLNCDFEQ